MSKKFFALFSFFFFFTLFTSAQTNCANITAVSSTAVTEFCGVGPHQVNFTNTSTGINSATSGYQWYLNGTLYASTTGIVTPPANSIISLGVYTYMMVAFDTIGLCQDTAFQVITVVQKPTANFTFNAAANYCPNDLIPFVNTSTDTLLTTKYFWGFGDSSQNPSVVLGRGGQVNVSLITYNSPTCSDTINQQITLLNTPDITIFGDDGTGDLINCLAPFDTVTQELVTFVNQSDSLITYTWDFGDGSPTVTQTYGSSPDTLTHLYTTYGTFSVICSAIAPNGCLYTDTLIVIFDKFISASFTIPIAQISGCTPHFVQPTNASVNATSYMWDFGDGTPPVITNSPVAPSHTYDSTGVYSITLTASNDCSFATNVFSSIFVSSSPEIDFTFDLIGRGCSPQPINFTNTSLYISPVTNYVWDMGNGNVYSGVPPPTQTYLQGNYSVKLKASNGCGTDSITQSFSIDSLPYALVTLSSDDGCSPMIVNASAIDFGFGTLSRWFVDGTEVSFGDTLPSQLFTNTSTSIQNHTIRYFIENRCGSYDTTITVVVHPSVQAILNTTASPICVGNSLTHSSLSTGDSLLYSWFFGDGSSTATSGPHTKTYIRKGLDSVKLVLTGYCGVDSITKLITVDSLPYAITTVSPLEGCSPLSVSGNSIPSGSGSTSTWFKNNAFYSNTDTLLASNFVNTGTALSTQTVRFNITNICGVFDTTYNVTIHPDVVAGINPVSSNVCVGDSVVFNNTSTGDSLNFFWRYSNGDTSTLENPPSRLFNTYGSDTTWLIVSGFCGVDSVFSVITVNNYPVADIVVNRLNGCEDLTVNFTNGAPNGANYNWSFNGGFPFASVSYTPTSVFATPGLNQVTLAVDSLGCIALDTTVIDVFAGPDASFVYTPFSGCSDLSVGITNTSPISSGDSYLWTIENGYSDTSYSAGNQIFTNTSNINDTVYNIKMVVTTANGCKDSVDQNVTVRPLPRSQFTLSDTIVCENEMVSFINTSVGGNSFKWYFGDGDSSFLNTPNHGYSVARNYRVQLITTSFWNCIDTSEQLVVVNPNPIVDFVFDSVCFGSSTTFFDSTLVNPATWLWDFGDGDTSNQQNPIHTYGNDSNYLVKLLVSNTFGCFDSVSKHAIVYTQPVANFSNSPACPKRVTSFIDSSSGNPNKWSWDFGDGVIDSVQNPTHIYTIGGTYNVTLIVENSSGCVDSITIPVLISTIPKTSFFADSVCIGYPTTFIDSTNDIYPLVSHQWSFGDGRISSVQNPIHQYLTAGTFAVSLTVTNSNGCDSTFIDSVVVYPAPQPSYTYTPLSGCSDLLVSFTNASPITIGDSYLWKFNNGVNDTAYSAGSQIFINTSNLIDSVYPVQLTITTSFGCIDSLTQFVTVRPLPSSSFIVSDSVVCEKEVISFTNTSIGASSYRWYFGDGDSSYFSTPIHSYDTAGTYIVSMVAISIWNCLDTSYDTIVVNNNPVVQFYSDSACLTFNTSFVDSTLYNPISWKWQFGDGDSSSIQNPVHLYGNDTLYRVTLAVENTFGCISTGTNITVVHTQPVAGFFTSAACAKKVTSFFDTTSGNPIKWYWDFGDGGLDSVKNPQHIFALGGNYTIMLAVENSSGCTDTLYRTIVISTVPQTFFVADSVCHGARTVFTNLTIVSYPILSYFWDFGDGNGSSAANPTYQYASPGVYTVSLTVENINGCDSTYSGIVVVNPMPIASFTHDTACFGQVTNFTNLTRGLPLYSIWDYGDGSPLDTVAAGVFSKTYVSSGTYLVKLLVVNNAGCRDSMSQTVVVNPTAVVNFSAVQDTVCFNDSFQFLNSTTNANLYSWSFGDGNNSNQINPTYSYANPGNYRVSLVGNNQFGCLDSSFIDVVVLPNPVADFNVAPVCFTNPSMFIDNSTGNNLSWSWSFGDGNTDTIQNPIHTYGLDSSFMTTLIVTSQLGCSDTVTKSANVLSIVNAQFGYSLACVNRPITFTDSSLGAPANWSWSFGDGTISAMQNPTHTYTASSNYIVELIVTNVAGCSDTLTRVVFVNTIPVPDFTADSICFGNFTTFTNLTTNSQPITQYFWDYGDGNNSFGMNPSYTFSAPGTYNVTLTVTNNGGCDSSVTKQVIVNAVPVADFLHDTVCLGNPTTFTDNSVGTPSNWKWIFGDFSPIDSISGSVASHNYLTAGQYAASLIISNPGNNCTSQVTKFITVLSGVDASFAVSTPICFGTNVQFVNNSTANAGGIVSTTWTFGDGTGSAQNNPTHLYGSVGVFRAKLAVVSSLGCTDSDSINVVVNDVPVANFNYVKNICLGNPTPFTDSSYIGVGTITNWNWNFGDGNTDTLQNPVNTFANSGSYLVTLQVTSDSGCTNNTSKLIVINPESTPFFTYKAVCVGDTVFFSDASTIQAPDSIISWYWEFGDGTTSLLQNPSHVYQGNIQTYPVKLTVTSLFGCSNDTTLMMSHFQVPIFNFGPEYYAYCENELVQFYDSSTILSPTNIVGWEWTFGDGYNSFIQNPSHIMDSAGSYYIKLKITTSDGCIFYDSLAAPLIIYPNPVAGFITIPSTVSVFRPEIYFDNQATGAINYFWTFGDGTNGTAINPLHMYPTIPGSYTATQYAYSSFGCVDSISKIITVKDEFNLYVPNAFTPDGNDNLNSTFRAIGYQLNNYNLKIFNRWGELIFETTDPLDGWNGKHNGENCPQDSYVYQIFTVDDSGKTHTKSGHVTLIR